MKIFKVLLALLLALVGMYDCMASVAAQDPFWFVLILFGMEFFIIAGLVNVIRNYYWEDNWVH